MLTRPVHLHDKCREVCIKARSPPALLPFKGQATEETTVKWPIHRQRNKFVTGVKIKATGKLKLNDSPDLAVFTPPCH